MALLQITTPEGTRVLELPAGQVTIGRSGGSDVVIEDERASRAHCSIHPVAGGTLLRDLGSRNGTKFRGRRIVEQILVPFGEPFTIGQTSLRVFEQSIPPVVPVSPSETAVDAQVDLPVAEVIEEDTLGDEIGPSDEDRLVSEARRDLNNLRTTGEDPGFSLNEISLLDHTGKPVHTPQNARTASPAVRTLRLLCYGAIRARATDLHFDPVNDGCQVRFRIDGKMVPVVLLPAGVARSLLSVVKVLSELDITGKHNIQDGSMTIEATRRIDCRVSLTPTMHGEKLVLRVLDSYGVPSHLEELGLSALMLKQIRGLCQLDAGMMLVSGPTGSGKTTTLYTALRAVDSKSRNVVTIEDPIEYHMEGITQIQTNNDKGLTFSHILKSVLRQDPDVILVGEIRDRETAQTAMQAAMTGHLVLTTLHARDTIGSIFRLLDLGAEAYMIANSISLCLAQRLVRVLCPHCKRTYRPKPSQLVKMKMESQGVDLLHTNVGCRRCMNVGYWGRTAVFELLNFNDNLRDALMTTKTIHDIRRAAGEWTYQSLLESACRKVIDGTTTLEEVERIATRD
ncbi:MAG TPA: ATPase, T2SS/T4P/T4SS family [Phycisphaerae bacterium]|nr:ATPase, T2SS/T4P/T4SS family [Phycisphaerae bacterium]HRY67229.1 ATPase, T2SS/T4P/T4SS family [Phycisphaerae bacterium]HSA26401.1 ATPase, T2SS/T4P/T4SS family [Phycisphaerae bacterium]